MNNHCGVLIQIIEAAARLILLKVKEEHRE